MVVSALMGNEDVTFVNFDPKVRFATDAEKQFLIDKLHEKGKDWDAEKERNC